jgi:hypothetical protein
MTADDGTFSFGGLPPSGDITYEVSASKDGGYPWTTIDGIVVGAGEVTPSLDIIIPQDTVGPTWSEFDVPSFSGVGRTAVTVSWPEAMAQGAQLHHYEVSINNGVTWVSAELAQSYRLTGLAAGQKHEGGASQQARGSATLSPAPAEFVVEPAASRASHALPADPHAQAALVCTSTFSVPPSAPTEASVGDSVNSQVGGGGGGAAAASCVTVSVCPPAVMCPVRGDETVFAAAVHEMAAAPVPRDGAIVSQGASLAAVHAHVSVVWSDAVPVPPPPAAVAAVGESA